METQDKKINVTIDREAWRAVRRIALDDGVPASAIVRKLINDFLASRQDANE